MGTKWEKITRIIKHQLQFEWDIQIELAHHSGKAVIDRNSNKRRTNITKFLNFKDKQKVLSEYKARKLRTKGIFINEDFSADTIEKRKGLFQRAKELREEGTFSKVVYNISVVHNRRSRLENMEEVSVMCHFNKIHFDLVKKSHFFLIFLS